MAERYHDSEKRRMRHRLQEYLKELPLFSHGFFRSKENKLEIRTLCGYAEDLLIFFRYLGQNNDTEPKDLSIEAMRNLKAKDIEEYLRYTDSYIWNGLEHHNGENGKQRKLASLRMFCRYLLKMELIQNDPTGLVDMPKLHRKNIVVLSAKNKKMLLDTVRCAGAGNTEHYQQRAKLEKNRLRDLAVFMVLLGTGIRVSELAGLNMSDVDFSENRLNIVRKGGNEDFVYFNEDVAKALKNYLLSEINGCRESFTPGPGEAAVFLSQQHKRMTVRSIQKMVKIYANMALGEGNHISPHKMRSSYGTSLYESTHDLELVSVALGHQSIETARKHYVRFKDEQKKRAAIPVE